MRSFPITFIALLCGGALSPAWAEQTPEALLLQQIRTGESSNRPDIVEQALYRLESIDPKNPELIAAKIRLSLRQQDRQKALEELDMLKRLAPDSDAYKQAMTLLMLNSESGQQDLENARLLVRTGHLQEAKEAYDKLFDNSALPIDIAAEYWQLIARFPGQRLRAVQTLQDIDRKSPGNPALREALVNLLFDGGQNKQAFALLQLMAAETATKDAAAELWLDKLKAMPTSKESIDGLRLYLTFYGDRPNAEEVNGLIEQQQRNLANPAFVARQTGFTIVNDGGGARAIPELKRAIADTPNDAQVAAALATAYERAGNRSAAISYYTRANRLDNNSGSWNDDIRENRYWLLVKQGDTALDAKRFDEAAEKYRQANAISGNDTEALLGLGDVATAAGNNDKAIEYYRRVLAREPYSRRALNKVTAVYLADSPQAARRYLDTLSVKQKAIMRADIASLYSDILQAEAEASTRQGNWAEAVSRLSEARSLTPDDVWLNYRLANAMWESGAKQDADAVLAQCSLKRPGDPTLAYAHALYLSGTGRVQEAEARLARLDKTKWDQDLNELAQRLALDKTLAAAERLREDGDEARAIAYLQGQPQSARIDLTLADWAVERGDYQSAQRYYQQTLARDPNNEDAILGSIETDIARGNANDARLSLARLSEQSTDSLNRQRRIANAWQQLGESERAGERFRHMRSVLQGQMPSQDSALAWRDIARAARAEGRPQQALDDYRYAMVAAGVTPTVPTENERFTQLARSQEKDDWLKRSVRADTDRLYRQQNTTITLDHDYWGSSGTKGVSDLTAQTTMLEAETPLYNGRFFARADYVQMNAGAFSAGEDGKHYKKFGACYEIGCDRYFSQKASGTSLAVGWRDERWNLDLGTTPLGFEVTDWVGGINYKTDFFGLGWTFTASRRPISSSLLSFAGSKDPITGVSWGGVRATGGGIGLSYDNGEENGVWADASVHQISGKNVENNQRERLMAGYYRRLINEVDREVTVGLNSMLWHYGKDLSGYSLGQGGYYSPQSYFSLSIPLNYRQRTENWSWELAGSVSWSTSSTHDERRYPIRSLVNNGVPDADEIESGSRGRGFGYTARALVERRLTSHWSIGAGIDIQEAKDYTPSRALLYMRYYFNDWRGNMDMPPQPLTPYADFK